MIGSVNAEGLRGGLALHDFKQGDIVASLPMSVAIDVGPAHFTAAVCECPYWREQITCQMLRPPGKVKVLRP